MLTYTAADTVMLINLRFAFSKLSGFHRTLLFAQTTAYALVFVYTHAQYKRQLAAQGMHQSLRRTYRAQKIAEAATTFCEDAKDKHPHNSSQQQTGCQ